MSACEATNKYGLREYSFEIGPMDDSSETVAIVGLEYSSVSEDEKFYSKEDVDTLIAGKDAEIRRRRRAEYKRKLMATMRKQLQAWNYQFERQAGLLAEAKPGQKAKAPKWGLAEMMRAVGDLEGAIFPESYLEAQKKALSHAG